MTAINNIKKIPEIAGTKISLRALSFSDAGNIYQNVKDKDVAKWLISISHPYTKTNAARFIRKTHYDVRKNKAYVFAMVLKKENELIGTITLSKLDYKNKSAELGYWLGKRYWKQGLMTEAVKLILYFGFRKLKLHRISSALFEKNIASKRVLEKSGFRAEGRLRQSRFKCGRWHNELRYGILCSEYKNIN